MLQREVLTMAAKKAINVSNIPLRTRNDQMEMTWCFERNNNRCMPHYHLSTEIVYVECGAMMGMVAGQELCIHEGQMAVISSYAIHSFSTPDTSRVIVAVIPMDFVPDIYKRLRDQAFTRVLIENPEPDLIFLIQLLFRRSKSSGRETIQSISQTLLCLLIDLYGLQPTLPLDSSGIMHLIIPYMQQHFMEDIKLEDLSRQFSYSKSRLTHLFQEQLHMTFTDFLNALRCRYAATLLRSQADTVVDIAELSGFRSVSTFYRVFKQFYGVSPLEYVRRKEAVPALHSV